jgi:hypothetical protein
MATEYRVNMASALDLPAVSEALTKQAAEGWKLHTILPGDEVKGKLRTVLVVMERTS